MQIEEACSLGQAWGAICGALVINPRMSRKSICTDKLLVAAPELFSKTCPVPSKRTYGLRDRKSVLYLEEKAFFPQADIDVVEGPGVVPIRQLIEAPADPMWEHDGKCHCGRHTFLCGQCLKCLAEDEDLRRADQEEQAREMNTPEESVGRSAISRAATTQSVIAIAAEHVREFGRTGVFPNGLLHTQPWRPGQTVSRPVKAGAGCRIVFAIEGRDVMQVQECVDPDLERKHIVEPCQWFPAA